MQRQPITVLFPGYRRRVLALLLLHPDESLHGREIARRTGLPSGTITRELSLLADAGLLTRERRGNQVLYGANRSSPIFAELASILRKTSGLADVLAERLSTVGGAVDVSFIYGSAARGDDVAGSDIDLMVIGDAGFGDIARCLHPAQEALGREINPKVFRAAEWRQRVAAGDPFVIDVLARPKIFIVGSADELEELGGDQPRRSQPIEGGHRKAARGRKTVPGRRKSKRH